MDPRTETAILAGGCFWIMEELLRHRDGVVSTRVGFTGGEMQNPTEDDHDGHAEAVEVIFDPDRLTYRELLEYFFQVHRADLGPELVGDAYRSEVFCLSDEQRGVAERTIVDVEASGHWPGKVVTRVSDAGRFWEAEAEDQGWFKRYPGGCRSPFPSAARASGG
jgi:peptide-methionine (S)-S-oxide reductase